MGAVLDIEGRAKLFGQWARGLKELGYIKSAEYWQKVADELRAAGGQGNERVEQPPAGMDDDFGLGISK